MGLDNREIITVDFDGEGNPEIHVKGMKGKACKDATAALERALGKTVSDKLTADYHTVEQRNVIQH